MAKTRWRDTHYVTVYRLIRDGSSEKQAAKALGVSQQTFNLWKRDYPALQDAIDQGRAKPDKYAKEYTFRDYVYDRLPDGLKAVWDEIDACEKEELGVNRIDAILAGHGTNTRKHLFLYALVNANFSPSGACRKLGMPRKHYDNWLRDDPDFAALLDEIHTHKKDFYEGALVGLVRRGEPSAVIFANKTYNKDRGYNEKVDLALSGHTAVSQTSLGIEDLDLPLDVRRQILAAVRAKTGEAADND